jgi:WD40 repeat protein
VIAALGTNNEVMATAPGRGLLACTSPGGPIRVWSLQSANLVTNLGGPPGPVDGLRFSQGEGFLLAHNTSGLVTSWEQSVGGEGVATGGAHNTSGLVTIWEAKNWTKRSSFTETYGAYSAAALSADGRLLVMGSDSGGLVWWDAVRGQRLAETNFHHAGVEGLDFSPNGTSIASTSSDGRVALWDTKTRGLIAHWRATHLGAHSVAFSPDGARLLTGLSGGEAARLWDLRTRRELLTLTAPGGMFTCATFSPDGNGLVCGSYDGHCYLWRVPSFAELDAGW